MGEDRLPVRPPGHDPPGQAHRRSFCSGGEHGVRLCGGVLAIKAIGVRRYPGRLQGFELLASRLENEVQFFGHAAAVVEPPPCLRYASMNGSIPPSITF